MTDTYGELILEQTDERLLRITLSKPPANALDTKMLRDLKETLVLKGEASHPPAVLLTGAGGRFFSAGGDIREFQREGSRCALNRMKIFHSVLCELEHYPAPVVAAVRGFAVGGAFEFLLFCDYVVACPSARFGFPEINHGLLPATKGMRQAATVLGRRAARTLLYSGELIGADEALAIGAIDEIVEVDEVNSKAAVVAEQMRSKDQTLFAAIKSSMARSVMMTDTELEELSTLDMQRYLDRNETADARARFFQRKQGH